MSSNLKKEINWSSVQQSVVDRLIMYNDKEEVFVYYNGDSLAAFPNARVVDGENLQEKMRKHFGIDINDGNLVLAKKFVRNVKRPYVVNGKMISDGVRLVDNYYFYWMNFDDEFFRRAIDSSINSWKYDATNLVPIDNLIAYFERYDYSEKNSYRVRSLRLLKDKLNYKRY